VRAVLRRNDWLRGCGPRSLSVRGPRRWVYHHTGPRSRQDSTSWRAAQALLSAMPARPVGSLFANLQLAWRDQAAIAAGSKAILPTLGQYSDKMRLIKIFAYPSASVEELGLSNHAHRTPTDFPEFGMPHGSPIPPTRCRRAAEAPPPGGEAGRHGRSPPSLGPRSVPTQRGCVPWNPGRRGTTLGRHHDVR
jgi:hypothetical protein